VNRARIGEAGLVDTGDRVRNASADRDVLSSLAGTQAHRGLCGGISDAAGGNGFAGRDAGAGGRPQAGAGAGPGCYAGDSSGTGTLVWWAAQSLIAEEHLGGTQASSAYGSSSFVRSAGLRPAAGWLRRRS